ncbi:hypothetical protein GWO43_22510, partial [candidate division KSB1 bacterium]|nr:hypothetical protein [candidate division KSB1 bacterium]NIR72719.1 hypothetical protein [candidate division KSB1 bacterium]NIS26804.1 hypothetical protein [candidate division KSB1 bacterium]NIT73598.1 hypothetical protein [candidate division KSB1 bacterium]NIU27474.1 hypothetical protein [candidate division KSB1 bacterium]
MRSYFYRLLFVITLLVSWGLVWSNTPYKSARFSKEHPFYGKVHRYLGVSGAASEKRAFEAEVKQLSRRMATKVQALRHAHGEVRVRQSESLIRLARISQGSLEVHWNEAHTRPIFIRGSRLQEKTLFKPGELTDANLQRQALAFLQENRELFQIEDPEREFKLLDIQRDRHGLIHLRYQQSYRDLEVWGR